jgi:hypothetical protein
MINILQIRDHVESQQGKTEHSFCRQVNETHSEYPINGAELKMLRLLRLHQSCGTNAQNGLPCQEATQ